MTQIEIEYLLQRPEICPDEANVPDEIDGKTVLVTGAAGSIGRGITLRLLEFSPRRVVLLDAAETPLYDLELELTQKFPGRDMVFVLSDVRSRSKMAAVFALHRPRIVFHAAAYKHVPVIESHPCEGVMTNVWGTVNTAHCAVAGGVEKFVMISTDKAVNPTNVMGATKRVAELWVRGLSIDGCGTRFITTRFGNVLGSNGSVIPLFRDQIAAGGPVTVTHRDMTRYLMTIAEACRLVLQAAAMGRGGEIFVFDMGCQVRIDNLARRMISLSGLVPDRDIKVEYTGLRPGEKLFEELWARDEAAVRTANEKIWVVAPDVGACRSVESDIWALIRCASRGDVTGTVRAMKRVVPEFRSTNSPFAVFDKASEK